MTLTSHAVIGTAVACLLPQNVALIMSVAFASHFVLDAMPHSDYPLMSMKRFENPMKNEMIINKKFAIDLIRVGLDAIIGLTLSFFIFYKILPIYLILIAAMSAMLPDALQFVYFKFKHEPFVSLQRFHNWVHTNHYIRNYFLGYSAEAAFIFIVAVIIRQI